MKKSLLVMFVGFWIGVAIDCYIRGGFINNSLAVVIVAVAIDTGINGRFRF